MILVLLLTAATATAVERSPAPAVEMIRAAAETTLADWNVPGMGLAVVAGGEVVMAEGFGVRQVGRPEPATADTLFGIGSCTKAFTAAAIGLLVEDGRLHWDDPVIRYLHGFEMPDRSDSGRVTVRDLLGHRTGLSGGDLISWGSTFTRQQIVERIRFLAPAASLRSEFHYNNNTYVAAGELIPAVTGRSWDDVVASRLLTPLGMSHTVTGVGLIAADANRASPHALVDGALAAIPPMNEHNCAAAGAIWSSASDMARWIRMLLDGGSIDGRRILRRSTIDELWQVQIPIAAGQADEGAPPALHAHFAGYGMGWFLRDERGRKLVSHGGESDGVVAQVTLIPEERIGLVILLNRHETAAFKPLSQTILDILLGVPDRPDWNRVFLASEPGPDTGGPEALPPEAGPEPPIPFEAVVGRYANPAVGDAEVRLVDGSPVLELARTPLYGGALEALGGAAFQVHRDYPLVEDSPVLFELDADGDVIGFTLQPDDTSWLASIPYAFERLDH